MKNLIVEEVRQIRNDYSKRFNYDLDAICEDYMLHQSFAGTKLVRLKPKAAKSGSHPASRRGGPLRTRRASFPASGSSLSKPR
jgi:hypothetical protein